MSKYRLFSRPLNETFYLYYNKYNIDIESRSQKTYSLRFLLKTLLNYVLVIFLNAKN